MIMKIEEGVPVPEVRGVGRPRAYAFEAMKVSTKSNPSCATIDSSYNTVYACLQRFKKIPEFSNMEFRLARHGDKVRVWRLK